MIRTMKEEDYESVKALLDKLHELHLENRPDIFIEGEPFPKDRFERIMEDENRLGTVYEKDGKIIGVVIVSLVIHEADEISSERKTLLIESIYIEEEYRRQGIGRELYEYILNVAKQMDVKALELNVWGFNENAIKFYEAVGMNVRNSRYECVLDKGEENEKTNK